MAVGVVGFLVDLRECGGEKGQNFHLASDLR